MAREHTIVTAADHRFCRTLYQFLLSARRRSLDRACEFIAYDLGLSLSDRRYLERRFPWCRLELFRFDRYAPHVRDLRTYAWKPIALWEVVRRRRGIVLWFDSATVFATSIDPIVDRVARHGVFSLVGQTALGDCADARTLATLAVTADDARRPYRAGGALGFDGGRDDIRSLVEQWQIHALDPDCIAPPGADPRVHRYDQAVLSALLYRRARTDGLVLTEDEIDISSGKPVPWFSTRNKVAAWMPRMFDPAVRWYYAAYKAVDRFVLATRRSRS